MRTWEISGNLQYITNYKEFSSNIASVMQLFIKVFGEETMTKIDLYVDNATQGSGYTPIITPVLGKYLIIKLGIADFSQKEQTIWQFSHELCHYLLYSLAGLKKIYDELIEETLCIAMSLCVLTVLCPQSINKWKDYVTKLVKDSYRQGHTLAEEINYDIVSLKDRIIAYSTSICV